MCSPNLFITEVEKPGSDPLAPVLPPNIPPLQPPQLILGGSRPEDLPRNISQLRKRGRKSLMVPLPSVPSIGVGVPK